MGKILDQQLQRPDPLLALFELDLDELELGFAKFARGIAEKLAPTTVKRWAVVIAAPPVRVGLHVVGLCHDAGSSMEPIAGVEPAREKRRSRKSFEVALMTSFKIGIRRDRQWQANSG